VVVIDTDLGVSGRWGVVREGFAELVARVCSGEVGAIFGIEISRLARSNAEVARLMEFAAITETLLVDADEAEGGVVVVQATDLHVRFGDRA
jgi:DNA invertase Pin-like site-specific DNA recombinase